MMTILNAADIFPGSSQYAETAAEQKIAEASANDFASLLAASYIAATPPPSNIALPPEPIPVEGSFNFAVPNNSSSTVETISAETTADLTAQASTNAFTGFTSINQPEIKPEATSITIPPATSISLPEQRLLSLPGTIAFTLPENTSFALPNSATSAATSNTELNQIVRAINQEVYKETAPLSLNDFSPKLSSVESASSNDLPVVSDVEVPTTNNFRAVESPAPHTEASVKSNVTNTKINAAELELASTNSVLGTSDNSNFTTKQSTKEMRDFDVVTFDVLPEQISSVSPSLLKLENIQTQFSAGAFTLEKPTGNQVTTVVEILGKDTIEPNVPLNSDSIPAPETSGNFPLVQIEVLGTSRQIHFENTPVFQKIQAEVKRVIGSLKLTDPLRPIVTSQTISGQTPMMTTDASATANINVSVSPTSTLQPTIEISTAPLPIATSVQFSAAMPGNDEGQTTTQTNNFKQENGGEISAAKTQSAANFPDLINELTAKQIATNQAATTANQAPAMQTLIPNAQRPELQISSDEITPQAIPAQQTNLQNVSAPAITTEKKADAPPPITQQAIEAITEASAKLRPQETQTLRLNLRPEKLGQIEIEIVRDEAGRVHASIVAASKETQQMLANDIGQLRQSLEQNGVVLARLDVLNTAQSQLQSQSQNQSQQQPQARPDNFLWPENSPAVPLVVNDPNNAEANKLLSLHA